MIGLCRCDVCMLYALPCGKLLHRATRSRQSDKNAAKNRREECNTSDLVCIVCQSVIYASLRRSFAPQHACAFLSIDTCNSRTHTAHLVCNTSILSHHTTLHDHNAKLLHHTMA